LKKLKTIKTKAVPDARSRGELRRLQEWVADAVTTPLSSSGGMRRRRADGGSTAAHAARFIKPNDRLTSLERLEIYNVQYWLRVIGSLREDFPALEAALGEKAFDRLCRAYLEKHPSRSFTLRNLGSRLPEFIARHPKLTGTKRRRRLALDVARFEWAQVVAFDGEALPPLEPGETADPAQLRLRLQPHLSLLDLAYPADAFVLALQKTQANDERLRSEASHAMSADSAKTSAPRRKGPPLPRPARTFLAVHRADHLLYAKRLEPEAFRLLAALGQGAPLSRAIAAAFPALPRSAAAHRAEAKRRGTQVAAWFALWAELGWLAASPRNSKTVA
jgi:Putative DNA-binding domain